MSDQSPVSSASAGSSESERIPGRLVGAIVAVGSLAFIGILTETVMTVLFPQLMAEFHVDTATVQWITTIYLLAVAVTMPVSSFLRRRFRLRALFAAAVALAVTGSLVMIVATAFPALIVARIIQGIGSGIATPLMINIILEQSPRSKIGRLMGVGALVITVAPAIGPTVGGAVASVLPWRAIFVAAVPLMLVAFAIGLACIEQRSAVERAALDPVQLVSVVLALGGMILALNQGGVAAASMLSGGGYARPLALAVGGLVVGFGSLAVFCVVSHRSASPLLRLGILRDPVVLLHWIEYLILPIVGIGFGYVITNVAQLALGADAFLAGALVLPGALIGAICSPLGGWLYDRFGAVRPILVPLCIASLGPALLCAFAMRLTPAMLAGFYFIFGFFYSLGNPNVMTNALNRVPRDLAPDGNAIFNTALQFGGAAGTALFSTILAMAQTDATSRGFGEGTPQYAYATAVGGRWTFAVMTLICAAGVACMAAAFRIARVRARRGAAAGEVGRCD